MTEQLTDSEQTYALDRQHVFHSWSAQAKLDPMVVTKAAGSRVWDGAGNSFLDFSSQLVYTNLGHQHAKVVQAIQEQAATLCTVAPGHASQARSQAAALIASHTPSGMDKIFFTNGGADANEHAIRMARLRTGRSKVLTRYRSYHGGTDLAVNLTGEPRRWRNDDPSAGAVHFFGPFLYRSQFSATTEEEECQRALDHLEQVILLEGPETIAAILLESIPGTAGIMIPPPGYLQGVRKLCDRFGICFVADEVMAGFGRSGRWFSFEQDNVAPDLLTFAKGVNSGYVPLGGVAISDEIADPFADQAYPGGLTYSGHLLGCAAAVAAIRAMEDEHVIEHAQILGRDVLGPGLQELQRKHEWIGEVRGTGAFWAIELVADRDTREPLAPYGGSSAPMAAIVAACKRRGLLPMTNFNRVHMVPPLNTSVEDTQEAIGILDEALAEARTQSPG